MAKKIIFVISILLMSAGCSQKTLAPIQSPVPVNSYNQKLQIGQKTLAIEAASTPEKMTLGLSGRNAMAADQGMLFDFKSLPDSSPEKDNGQGVTPAFWMKDMKFNLDLVWIKSGHVVGVTPDVPAPIENLKLKIENSDLPIYSPPSPVDWVLEVNAGWSALNKIKTGDEVRIIN